jgi:pimeloyl-ACP methyl ester carboxylesterase
VVRRYAADAVCCGLLILGLSSGCASLIDIPPNSEAERNAREQRSALNSGRLSESTESFLRHRLLLDRARAELEPVVESCIEEFDRRPDRTTALVIAELAYLAGQREVKAADRAARFHATTMLYAYTYLFADSLQPPVNAYAPTFRRACDFYNQALLGLVQRGALGDLRSKTSIGVESMCGPIEFALKRWEMPWPLELTEGILPTSGLEVAELVDRFRSAGLGLPLIVTYEAPGDSPEPPTRRFFPRTISTSSPATLLVRLDKTVSAGDRGKATFRGAIEVYDPIRAERIEFAGLTVPLETDITAPLAYMFGKAPPFPVIDQMLDPPEIEKFCGLNMLLPYQRGKIPVVFVHGLLSRSSTWTQMINDLLSDSEIRRRYQFWEFQYATGNPLLYSANLLRKSLGEARAVCDPRGDDHAFDQTVIVGASMGGLVTRLCVSSGNDDLWSAIAEMPRDQTRLSAVQRQYVEELIYFKPVPFVRTAIFMATPHLGSKIANSGLARALSKKINFSPEVATIAGLLYAQLRPSAAGETVRPRSGVDNLSPECPILGAISQLPFAPDVSLHSIIANHRAADTPGGTDLVVEYASSHLAQAKSEKIVFGDHDLVGNPAAILEVRRILQELLTPWRDEQNRE